jgi:hypothetical protein
MPELKIGNTFEVPKKPEASAENISERPDFNLEKPKEGIEKKSDDIPVTSMPAPAPVAPLSLYEDRQKQIEKFLSRDLEEIYLSLPPEKKVEFKKAGEETAIKINKLLEKTKINLGKIVNLIKKWLAIIPGINKFFLEQEAKIRADEIFKMKS